MAAGFCNIQPGDTIAICGCGPVGQMAIRSAFMLGAERVIAIDTVPERLALAPVRHYMPKLMARIESGEFDPSFVITHSAGLEDGPELYKTLRDKQDGCIKMVLKP